MGTLGSTRHLLVDVFTDRTLLRDEMSTEPVFVRTLGRVELVLPWKIRNGVSEALN